MKSEIWCWKTATYSTAEDACTDNSCYGWKGNSCYYIQLYLQFNYEFNSRGEVPEVGQPEHLLANTSQILGLLSTVCVGIESGTGSSQAFLTIIHSLMQVITADKSYGDGQVTTDAGGWYRWNHFATILPVGGLGMIVACCWQHSYPVKVTKKRGREKDTYTTLVPFYTHSPEGVI